MLHVANRRTQEHCRGLDIYLAVLVTFLDFTQAVLFSSFAIIQSDVTGGSLHDRHRAKATPLLVYNPIEPLRIGKEILGSIAFSRPWLARISPCRSTCFGARTVNTSAYRINSEPALALAPPSRAL